MYIMMLRSAARVATRYPSCIHLQIAIRPFLERHVGNCPAGVVNDPSNGARTVTGTRTGATCPQSCPSSESPAGAAPALLGHPPLLVRRCHCRGPIDAATPSSCTVRSVKPTRAAAVQIMPSLSGNDLHAARVAAAFDELDVLRLQV